MLAQFSFRFLYFFMRQGWKVAETVGSLVSYKEVGRSIRETETRLV